MQGISLLLSVPSRTLFHAQKGGIFRVKTAESLRRYIKEKAPGEREVNGHE